MLRIVLADDHQLLREAIRRGLEEAGEAVVGEASTGDQAVALARSTRPNIVVMDLSMPQVDGVEATRRINAELPGVRVLVLSMHDDPARTRAAIGAGASGYLTKGTSFAQLLFAIRSIAAGETFLSPELAVPALWAAAEPDERADQEPLTDRQVEILQMVANGSATKQVARDLGITQKTVHNHYNSIYRKLNSQSLTHAVLRAVRMGIVQLD
ncbi:MAG TPA: response regulator transcription factor [Microthrixaceae bacterium]|nr:response regulator transcription factor [Microthrixaceae bacterium]HNI36046.1 response regulator transcription factor [Microthrixaceae bacterium]